MKLLIVLYMLFLSPFYLNNQIKLGTIKKPSQDTLITWNGKLISKRQVIDSLTIIFRAYNDSLIREQRKLRR